MGDLWLGRHRSPIPIRCRGPLHFYSARDDITDRLSVVVVAPRIPEREARLRLAGLARTHKLVAGPHVPGVVEEALDGPTPWVALDCDAVADLETVRDFVREGGDKPPLVQASVLSKIMMDTLARCHLARDPVSQRPVCLGAIAAGNILFASDGTMWLVGFGAGPLVDACQAPEVGAGAPPTPGADVYAVTLFVRGQLEFVQVPRAMRRVFSGRSFVRDANLVLLLVWSNRRILAAAPSKRADMDAALAKAQDMWRGLGFSPDVEGFRQWVRHAIASEPERLADTRVQEVPRIVLGHNGEWLETPNGMRHALGSRRPLRRMLLALAAARHDRAGATLTTEELLRAGWPGENPFPEAGNNRVYVAISTLRKLGLGDLLQRWDNGYRLDPAVPCQFKNP